MILHVRYGDGKPKRHAFLGPRVSLGKARRNTLSIPSPHISRFHGEFIYSTKQWKYKDLRSLNGTRIRRGTLEILLNRHTGDHEIDVYGGEEMVLGDVKLDVEVLPDHDSALNWPRIHSQMSLTSSLNILQAEGFEQFGDQGHRVISLLFQNTRRLTECTTEDAVMDVIGRTALTANPSITHIAFFERTDDTDKKWIRKWSRARPGLDADVPYSTRLLDSALEEGQSLLFNMGQGDISQTASTRHVNFSIYVPLRGHQGYLGVLQADCRATALPATDRDLHIMTLLGHQGAALLDQIVTIRHKERMIEGFVDASVKAIEARDPCTAGHSSRVAQYCMDVANAINEQTSGPFASVYFDERRLQTLRYAALLHDFGKVGVREKVLIKEHKLSPEAYKEVQGRFGICAAELRALAWKKKYELHASGSTPSPEDIEAIDRWLKSKLEELEEAFDWLAEIIKNVPIDAEGEARLRALCHVESCTAPLTHEIVDTLMSCQGTLSQAERAEIESHARHTLEYLKLIPWSPDLRQVPAIAGAHHEKLNGRGYPHGLESSQIPLETRILTVCDIYDAITARDRPYRAACKPDKAFEILRAEIEIGAIDRDVCTLFQSIIMPNDGRLQA